MTKVPEPYRPSAAVLASRDYGEHRVVPSLGRANASHLLEIPLGHREDTPVSVVPQVSSIALDTQDSPQTCGGAC